MSTTDFKAILLMACEKINNASVETITILRGTPISSLKVIRGIAKGDRDPDPLSSTMLQMNRKYPITIDGQHAKTRCIPKQFLGPDDFHLYKRRLCKLEAVPHYLDVSPVPTEEEQNITKVMYKQHDEDAQQYNAINWENARISFGNTVLSKVYAPTRTPVVSVPKDLRENLVIQTLCPELSIPYDEINPFLVKLLKEVASSTINNKMTFIQQSRILLKQMDPRVKLQPLPPGYEEWMGTLRYALFGARWSTTNVGMNENNRSEEKELFKNLIKLNEACTRALKKKISTPSNLRKHLQNSTYRMEKIDSALQRCQNMHNQNLKILCVLLGLPTTMTSEINGITFSPAPSRIMPVIRRNLAGVQYKAYRGGETVYFKREEVTGLFYHEEDHIPTIIMTITSPSNARSILASIGQYCRFGFSTSNAKTKEKMIQETYKNVISNPTLIFKTRPCYEIGMHGVVQFREEVEFETHKDNDLVLDDKNDIINTKTKQVLQVCESKETLILCKDFEMPICCLKMWSYPNQRLYYMVTWYMKNWSEVKRKVQDRDFTWQNGTISELLAQNSRQSFSFTARSMCYAILGDDGLKSDKFLLSFYYCFAGAFQEGQPVNKMYLGNWAGLEIDLLVTKGLVTTREGNYYIGNILVTTMPKDTDLSICCPSILNHTRMQAHPHPNEPTYSTVTAKRLLENMPDGHKFNVATMGRVFGCVKDSFFDLSLHLTMSRHYNSCEEMIDPSVLVTDLKRIFTVAEPSPQEECCVSPLKKPKYD